MKQIQQQLDQGLVEQAEESLDNLLELGPKNIAALKMRALLYEQSGQFMQESKIWERVGKVDSEDTDYLEYLERRQNEERDRFDFTDELPGGGRRFLGNASGVGYTAGVAFLGCLFFLVFVRTPVASDPRNQLLTMTVFALCVLAPWLALGIAFLRTIRHISVDENGLEIAFRFRIVTVKWSDLEQAWTVYHHGLRNGQLALILIPRDPSAKAISIDLMRHSTAIYARSHFLRDVAKFNRDVTTVKLNDVYEKHLKHRQILYV